VCRATVGTPRLLFFVLQYFPPRGTRRPLREAKSSCWHIIMFLYLLYGSSVVAFVVALSGRPLPCPTRVVVFPPGLFADSVSRSHACCARRWYFCLHRRFLFMGEKFYAGISGVWRHGVALLFVDFNFAIYSQFLSLSVPLSLPYSLPERRCSHYRSARSVHSLSLSLCYPRLFLYFAGVLCPGFDPGVSFLNRWR